MAIVNLLCTGKKNKIQSCGIYLSTCLLSIHLSLCLSFIHHFVFLMPVSHDRPHAIPRAENSPNIITLEANGADEVKHGACIGVLRKIYDFSPGQTSSLSFTKPEQGGRPASLEVLSCARDFSSHWQPFAPPYILSVRFCLVGLPKHDLQAWQRDYRYARTWIT